jgi:hypothetical protein
MEQDPGITVLRDKVLFLLIRLGRDLAPGTAG